MELRALYRAFATGARLRILERLGKVGEESVNDLAADLHMSQPHISWHLRTLRLGGVIRTRREGRQVYCSLDVATLAPFRARFDELLGIKEKMKIHEDVGVWPPRTVIGTETHRAK